MLLPVVTEAIKQSPKHIAGISFSDRSIRFVEVERHKDGVLTLSSFGQLTIPYDVMEQGRVVNMVEFTEVIRKLNSSLSKDTRIILRKDNDPHKIEALRFAGYDDLHTKEGIDSLRGVFVPWQTDAKRICLFANYDMTYALEVTGYETRVLGKISKQELFSPRTGELLRSYIDSTSENRVLLAGKYQDASYVEQLEIYGLAVEETNIWQNLFDFSRYIPEIPQDNSYQYTVPAGLLVAGLMSDTQEVGSEYVSTEPKVAKKSVNKNIAPVPRGGVHVETTLKEAAKNKEKPEERERGGLADFLADVEPLTKLDEDKRKQSERSMSRKYTKLLK